MSFCFPKIYPILDSKFIPTENRDGFLRRLAESLAGAGVTLLEYRNKSGSESQILADAEILRTTMPKNNVKLILDDRVDLIENTMFDGVHIDAGDLAAPEVRGLLGPSRIIGTFGGSESLVPGVLALPVDYWSIGPVCATTTKQTTTRPIGTVGVRRLREEAGPEAVLVAVGGVTFASAAEILAAGATTVAVAAAIFGASDPAAEFARWIDHLG